MTLLPPKGKRKSWYYDLTVNGIRVTKGGFKTKADARTAREARRQELKHPTPIVTDYNFREVANEYLDYSQRRFSGKNYRGKIYVYRCTNRGGHDDESFFGKIGRCDYGRRSQA